MGSVILTPVLGLGGLESAHRTDVSLWLFGHVEIQHTPCSIITEVSPQRQPLSQLLPRSLCRDGEVDRRDGILST